MPSVEVETILPATFKSSLLIFIIILYYQKVATLPLFVTAKIQKISKNAQFYYQKVVNLPFFVTTKAQIKAFTTIYKQKVVK